MVALVFSVVFCQESLLLLLLRKIHLGSKHLHYVAVYYLPHTLGQKSIFCTKVRFLMKPFKSSIVSALFAVKIRRSKNFRAKNEKLSQCVMYYAARKSNLFSLPHLPCTSANLLKTKVKLSTYRRALI